MMQTPPPEIPEDRPTPVRDENSAKRPHPLETPQVRRTTPGDVPIPAGARTQRVTLAIPSVAPIVTYVFLAINIAIFALRAISPTLDENVFLWGANNQTLVLLNGEFHRLLSSMFLHAGIYNDNGVGGLNLQNSLHLLLNGYIIYTAGAALERYIGHARYLIIYLLGGITGSLLSICFNDPNVYSLGASGAVFAILGAQFIFLYKHRRLFGEAGRRQMQSLAVTGLINLAFGILSDFGGRVRIDNWAHIGGAIGGIILAWFISPDFLPKVDASRSNTLVVDDLNPVRERLWLVSLYGAVLLVVLIVAQRLIVG